MKNMKYKFIPWFVTLFALCGINVANANEVSTVDCNANGIKATTWSILGVADISVPIPVPYKFSDGQQCLVADFNGDGLNDLLVQGMNAGDDSFIFHAEADGKYQNISQKIASNELGVNWSSVDALLIAKDLNNDGKADIKVESKSRNVVQMRFYLQAMESSKQLQKNG